MNLHDAHYDELLRLTYACVLDRSTWHPLLERLGEACGHQRGILLAWDARQPHAQIALFHQAEADAVAAYSDYFHRLDPTGPAMKDRAPGAWYHDDQELGSERIRLSPYYQEFKRPYGMRGVSCLKLQDDARHSAYLSLLTNHDARSPHEEQRALLARVTPHLMRAARMANVVESLELHLLTQQRVQNEHRAALWLVNAEGYVVFCNGAAERQLATPNTPLLQRNDRLALTHPGQSLAPLLQRACGRAGPPRAGWMRLPGPLSVELLVTPVQAETHFNLLSQQPLALVTLLVPGPRAELLSGMFGFTPAECRLASLLARGLSPEACGRSLGVSINTVRSQLRALLAKTGTTRQAELVRVLVRLQ
ncbi:helix-turn-helix transcriptional regulator [Pseudomonas sp. ABC1]|uniref:helix-turn-helix transcriptional regulator n=1 Tax=Pseudomonas sp. ABC1 TaxID=2748080 RepID=UPI0015C3259B|nr:helix-turn-helix transcriptional regulator [Pseudomonas sp. ABC1]QLF93648.1 helix-turn-helix transcriptional regulator [Pseudomonas sp. ABC1]